MKCPWCNRLMILHNRFCPSCGNDLKGVTKPTLVSEKNLKKWDIKLQKYLKRGEEKFSSLGEKK